MDNGLSAFISTAVEHVNCALNALRFLPSRGVKECFLAHCAQWAPDGTLLGLQAEAHGGA